MPVPGSLVAVRSGQSRIRSICLQLILPQVLAHLFAGFLRASGPVQNEVITPGVRCRSRIVCGDQITRLRGIRVPDPAPCPGAAGISASIPGWAAASATRRHFPFPASASFPLNLKGGVKKPASGLWQPIRGVAFQRDLATRFTVEGWKCVDAERDALSPATAVRKALHLSLAEKFCTGLPECRDISSVPEQNWFSFLLEVVNKRRKIPTNSSKAVDEWNRYALVWRKSCSFGGVTVTGCV